MSLLLILRGIFTRGGKFPAGSCLRARLYTPTLGGSITSADMGGSLSSSAMGGSLS